MFLSSVFSLLAHVRAYHIYEDEFKSTQNGKCGITLNSGWSQPEDPENEKDVEASEIAMSLYLGWWGFPIYGDSGDYSERMIRVRVEKMQKILHQILGDIL